MRIITVLWLLAFSIASADDLICDGCVHSGDIRGQAVITQKIAREAVTEGKLSPEVQRKLNGLIVTDGVGRRLPITITSVTASFARGYYRLENGAVMPIGIGSGPNGQPYQIYGDGPTSYVATRSISFTGAGCTGQAFVIDYEGASFLFPYSLISDPQTPNRSRLIYQIGDELAGPLQALSYMHDFAGCVDIDTGQNGGPLDGYTNGLGGYLGYDFVFGPGSSSSQGPVVGPALAYFSVNFEGSIKWAPPLTIGEFVP